MNVSSCGLGDTYVLLQAVEKEIVEEEEENAKLDYERMNEWLEEVNN